MATWRSRLLLCLGLGLLIPTLNRIPIALFHAIHTPLSAL